MWLWIVILEPVNSYWWTRWEEGKGHAYLIERGTLRWILSVGSHRSTDGFTVQSRRFLLHPKVATGPQTVLSGSSQAHLRRLFGIQPLGAGTEKGSARCSLSLALCQRSEAERSSSSCSANPSYKSRSSSTLTPLRSISTWVFVWKQLWFCLGHLWLMLLQYLLWK